MKENDLLHWIYRQGGMDPRKVLVGPGDDMAVLTFDRNRLLVAVDQVHAIRRLCLRLRLRHRHPVERRVNRLRRAQVVLAIVHETSARIARRVRLGATSAGLW